MAFFLWDPRWVRIPMSSWMSSKCRDVGNVQKRRDGLARNSHASSRGEGWEPDVQRAAGRGTIGESLEGGMTDCLLSTSPSALSVRPDLAQEKADRNATEAEVAYWRLPRRKPRKWRVRWVSGSLGRGYLQDGQLNRYH